MHNLPSFVTVIGSRRSSLLCRQFTSVMAAPPCPVPTRGSATRGFDRRKAESRPFRRLLQAARNWRTPSAYQVAGVFGNRPTLTRSGCRTFSGQPVGDRTRTPWYAQPAGFAGVRAPGALPDRDDRHAGRAHPGLLRPAQDQVGAPGVHLQRQRAGRADRVAEEQRPALADDRADRLQVVGDAGRRLVVGEEDALHVAVPPQRLADRLGRDRPAPRDLQLDDLQAVGARDPGEALAERPADERQDAVAGREEVGDARFQGAGAVVQNNTAGDVQMVANIGS